MNHVKGKTSGTGCQGKWIDFYRENGEILFVETKSRGEIKGLQRREKIIIISVLLLALLLSYIIFLCIPCQRSSHEKEKSNRFFSWK